MLVADYSSASKVFIEWIILFKVTRTEFYISVYIYVDMDQNFCAYEIILKNRENLDLYKQARLSEKQGAAFRLRSASRWKD